MAGLADGEISLKIRVRIYLRPRVTVIADLLHSDRCDTKSSYHNMCLPGLIKNHWIVLTMTERDFCDLFRHRVILTFDLLPKS